MAFSRRKGAGSESTKRSRRGRGASRDPFEHLSEERAKAEEGEPWFLSDDDDAPDLNVQAGISSNLRPEDLALLQEGVGSGPPTTPREAVRPDRPPVGAPPVAEHSGPGGEAEPHGIPVDPGQADGSRSVFPAADPDMPGPYRDSEPPPQTGAFPTEALGPAGHSSLDDVSRTLAFGERRAGDTLALQAEDPDITPLYTEPIAAEAPEPAAVVAEIKDVETPAPEIEPELLTSEREIESDRIESSEPAAGSEQAETDPTPDESGLELGAGEASADEIDDVDDEASGASDVLQPDDILTSYSGPEHSGLANAIEESQPEPDVTPMYPEPVAAETYAEPGPDRPDHPASDVRDEEPLRSALLQSFKDVVARTPTTTDDEGENEGFDLGDVRVPEEPEHREVIPRKPPARPRRF